MTPVTKWIGALFVLFFAVILALLAVGIAIRLSLVLMPVFLVALPILLYELLFRAPSEGQAERDPAESAQTKS